MTNWGPGQEADRLAKLTRQDHKNQLSPLHNLTLLQPGIELLVSSGQGRTDPRLSLVSHKVFSLFVLSVTDGVLVPLAWLVGDS